MRVNPEFLRRGYLKKQSQFIKGDNNVIPVLVISYGNDGDYMLRKTNPNKANSKPIGGVWPEIRNKAGGEKFLSLGFCAGEVNIDADPLFAV